jgi:hypothetical protein
VQALRELAPLRGDRPRRQPFKLVVLALEADDACCAEEGDSDAMSLQSLLWIWDSRKCSITRTNGRMCKSAKEKKPRFAEFCRAVSDSNGRPPPLTKEGVSALHAPTR